MNYYQKISRGGYKGICLVVGILLACLLGMLSLWRGKAVHAQQQSKTSTQGSENNHDLTYQVDDMEVNVHVGMSGNAIRRGRFAPVHLILKNSGKDFEGIFRLYIDGQDANTTDRTVIDKKIQIAAGETKEYTMLLSYTTSSALQTALCDNKGKVLGGNHLDKQLVMTHEGWVDTTAVYGCISEDSASLSYITGRDELQAEAVQDWVLTDDARTLDIFDILVINQFDTTQFSEKQIAAIDEWVRMGGTLILGTGAQPEKTLKAFSGTLLQGTIGNASKISTSFGTDMDVSELQIENMKPILSQDDAMLVGRMDYGKGCVMVSTFDLAAVGDQLAERLQSLLYLNMSMDRKTQLINEASTDTDYTFASYSDMYGELSLRNGLRATEVNGLPNVALYAVLLLFYAVFIGPVLYFILRKRGKREWLWGLIPISAVVCSVLIYLIGTGTRVKHPYVNYLSQIDLSNKEVSTMQTNMMLTSPNNDPFDLDIPEKYIIPYRFDKGYYYSGNQSSNLDYKSRMEYRDKNTLLHMENLSAFDSMSFQQKQEVETQGRVEFTDVNLSHDVLSGIVTNQSGYDLEQCCILCNGDLLSLGDLKRGESISLDQLDASVAWVQNLNTVEGGTAAHVTGYDINGYRDNDVQGLRRTVMLNRYMNVEGNAGGYYFYGFLAPDQSTAYTEQYDVDLYGETAVVQQLNHDDLGELVADFVGALDVFELDTPSNLSAGHGLKAQEYTVHYGLEAAGVPDILQLSYQRSGNIEFELLDEIQNDPTSIPDIEDMPFLGKVYAVNWETGERELLFTAGQEAVVTDLTKYIDKKQQMELVYQIEDLDETQYPNQAGYYDSYVLPSLILERRIGS